ncbi:MAG: serine hydrolase domain-containing protein [Bacteroidales bacterium]
MVKSVFVLTGLIIIFFFGEIALTLSEKGNSFIIEDQEVAFSLKLENHYSDFKATEVIDQQVTAFMERWRINGASVAVSKDEELVYAKGFGYANTEKIEQVKPGHLFRIASVSKLITAAAVMKLYEGQLLDLDEFVFGPEGILDTVFYNAYGDDRVEQIRVRHLLNHTGGWSGRAGDPMFNSLYIARKLNIKPPAGIDHVIKYSLSQNLSYEPGTRYNYSNLGYAILGKIIEEKSGIPYEDFVVMNILKPAGIHDMHIGHSFSHEKLPNEVTYYNNGRIRKYYAFDGSGEMVPAYYGGNYIELLGAAGGWVASAPELCKLISSLDGFDGQRDILKKETIEMMIDPEIAGPGLFGWRGNDNRGTWWRTGYFNGSTAMVVRQSDGVNWVLLMNTSTYRQSRIHRYSSSMMFQAIRNVEIWPYLDLFMIDRQFPEPLAEIPLGNPFL